MTRSLRVGLFVGLCALLLSAAPARAQTGAPTVKDEGNNILLFVVTEGARFKVVDLSNVMSQVIATGTPAKLSPAYELYGAQEQLLWFR
jgi:hypothetical protein